MERAEMMRTIGALIDDAKAAVLATLDEQGRPQMRWMTPAVVKGREAIYAVTSPRFAKAAQLVARPDAQWLFQTRALTEVVSVTGTVNVIDTPAAKSEIMEAIGRRLTVFWNVNVGSTDFVVLETIIREAVYFRPMKGIREVVTFGG